ncbi:glycosyltransferase family 2 protein [Hymenobacter cheonanensis]|uniref:glycosyltransferase family 2 protein n=1 Tax=Hymenobacter sp. CA2-7 TaxID=3063993 RepID=UPI002714130F|nr:glycosyltransferase [Hymenobacter sp. CA2-7]MDO7884488.1 glycosyltransferase [Hymenobacter sp. CA2-7]
MLPASPAYLSEKTSPPSDSVSASSHQPYRLHFNKVAGLGKMRWLIAGGALCLVNFLWWFATATQGGYWPLFCLLALSLGFKALRMVHEWVHYAQVRVPVPPAYPPRLRTVDVLTTACPGEPRQMIINTLRAMQAITYPHTSYLCDEGNDPVLRAACRSLGVVHVTRQVKVNAKAGNINNALRQATGEMCVVLDPDHAPTPDFLDRVMPYFEDEQVGYVQVVQSYGNQAESLVARGAAEQTYHFYGPMMMGMNAYGTVQAIGANCTFRRTALDSIGGHAAGLTEDMHTAMRLHAEGWKSAYVPEVVSRGLVPASLAAFYSQQLKWSRGAFDLLFRVYPKLFGRFSWPQRLHYLVLPLYFFSGVIALIDLTLPVFSLATGQFPWLANTQDLLLHALPLLFMSLLIRLHAQRWLREPGESGLHLCGGLLRMSTSWVYTLGLLYAIIGVRVPYIPTPKEGRRDNEWLLILPNLLLAGLLWAASHFGLRADKGPYIVQVTYLSYFNIAILLASATMGLHNVFENISRGLRSLPLRTSLLRLASLPTRLMEWATTRARQYSPVLASLVLLTAGTVSYLHAAWLARVPPEWMLTSVQSIRVGQTISLAETQPVSLLAGLNLFESPKPACTITALPLPDFNASQPLPAAVANLVQQRQIPLLTWPVDASASLKKNYWHTFARQLNALTGPVLLRPLLAAPTAASYRKAWRHMHEELKQEDVINAVWVWTPDVADVQLQKFPGVTYTNWIASPLQAGGGAPSYALLRSRIMHTLAMHHVPVLLLAPAPSDTPLLAAQRLTQDYPELNTIVFAAPEAAQRMPTGRTAHRAKPQAAPVPYRGLLASF